MIERALRENEELAELGVTVAMRGGKFDAGSVTLKIEVALKTEDGVARGPEWEALHRLVGYKPRATRRPYIGERADGKRFVFPTAMIQRAFGVEVSS